MQPTVEERYHRDPMFRVLVDTLYMQIVQARYTPTEIREAAMLAQIHYEQRHVRAHIIPLRLLDEDANFDCGSARQRQEHVGGADGITRR